MDSDRPKSRSSFECRISILPIQVVRMTTIENKSNDKANLRHRTNALDNKTRHWSKNWKQASKSTRNSYKLWTRNTTKWCKVTCLWRRRCKRVKRSGGCIWNPYNRTAYEEEGLMDDNVWWMIRQCMIRIRLFYEVCSFWSSLSCNSHWPLASTPSSRCPPSPPPTPQSPSSPQ